MSDERPVKRWFKRVFERDSARGSKVSTRHDATRVPVVTTKNGSPYASNESQATFTVPVTQQTTTDPSASITALREKRISSAIQDREKSAVTLSADRKQDTDSSVAEVTSPSLWDNAYDSLRQEKPELLSEYEDLFSRVLIKAETRTSAVPTQEDDTKPVRNQIPQGKHSLASEEAETDNRAWPEAYGR
ncbi:uncharacterized protein BO97DRAFT_402029 [Aspergillus homomorphus CBS 101889]|uniref:Uncharacterized protein n=1 Tax=Aspergillus homomorphus (strain CBS 101889) TaxID=1450537 RepID=A0A395IBK5_ASPHC|nr:hypothetical protein BO97DRAFT_402029 [Aspergillus homomorphus CBS 101889]RAL17436.1 hypothetical protein BO97DRAFT_402029 [Aspergillus homomorphus CBS 101889]